MCTFWERAQEDVVVVARDERTRGRDERVKNKDAYAYKIAVPPRILLARVAHHPLQ